MTALARWLTPLLGLALLLGARTARTDTVESPGASAVESKPYLFTVRGAGGIGHGRYALGVKGSVSGEGWFSRYFGVGAFGGVWGDATPCGLFLCDQKSETTYFLGLAAAARTKPGRTSRPGRFDTGYGLLRLGAGYAWGDYSETRGSGNWLSLAPRPPPLWATYTGAEFEVTGAWLFHPWVFEIGPVVQFDATTWGSVMGSGNIALGLALP